MATKIRVVLVEPEHEGNIGSIARAMKNFGLRNLWLVRPRVKLGVEANAYATYAKDLLASAHIVPTIQKTLVGIDLVVGTTGKVGWSSRNVLRTPIDPKSLAKQVAKTRGSVALLFGRESKGLSNRELDLCDLLVTIPADPEYRTLNVAAAATIIIYELFAERLDESSLRKIEASGSALRMAESHFAEICETLELPSQRKELTVRAFRNVLRRSYVSQREASLLIGAMRRTSRRLRTEG